ncbi:MAG: FIST N-terminal domain-containing protein [Gallionellaceae bacterium]|nr:FIST N-terminal domain-containing protein [Gallionellaceae bacterium]
MQITQIRWTPAAQWNNSADDCRDADLVLVFADADYFQTPACYQDLKNKFPHAHIVGCSSSGTVLGNTISDGDVVATAVHFEQGKVRMATADVKPGEDIRALAGSLMKELQATDLKHVLVFSDGLLVNGSDLAAGLNSFGITVTGGLAGDGSRFGKTWVMADAPARAGRIAAIGLYGDLVVKSGCFAGWQEFGAERVVTKSASNVVSEIDNQPALALYKKYLGDMAKDLPGSGLRFPLSVRANVGEQPIIRTLLGVDENAQTLTFAGDVPQGCLCKLMRTDLDSLIESAGMAATAAKPQHADSAGLCLVISCVGRRLVLGQLTEEELEVVQENLGEQTTIAGFYSYGELAPFSDILQCHLHNQTMTLTTLYE